jgi:hypothetical protein
MGTPENPVASYLTEKKAGAFGGAIRGMGAGIGDAFTGGARELGTPMSQAFMTGHRAGGAIGKGAIGTAGAAAGAAAVSLAALGVHKLYDAATKTRDFNSMLAYAPDLAEAHAANPQHVNQMFSTLRMFNPDFTRDPVVSSGYVRQMVDNPGGAGGIAVEALQSRDKIKHTLSDNVLRAAVSGGKGGGKGEKKPKPGP